MDCASLVTGGAGFIGSHLVHALLSAGESVRVLDDFSTGNRRNLAGMKGPLELLEGSVTRPQDVERAVQGCQTIYHLAALPSVTKSVEDPLLMHEICGTGTLNVLWAAKKLGVRRIVYAGSSSAYGDQPGAQRRETDALIPLSPYAAAKLAGEHYCSCFTEVYGLETVRLRFFNVFGPRQDPKNPYSGVIALFIAALCEGRTPTVFGDGLQSRDFVYVENVVHALRLAGTASAAVGKVYNVGMGSSITVLDLIAHLNDILNAKIEPTFAPPRSGDVRFSQADISKARADLGFSPDISFRDGLARTVEAYLAEKS